MTNDDNKDAESSLEDKEKAEVDAKTKQSETNMDGKSNAVIREGDKDTDVKEAVESEEEKKKKQEELKKKYANWPLRGIKDPHENDVMYGRGGGTNHHPGNKRYRQLVEDRKLEYVNSKRLDKPLVALEIIRLWRAQIPPGRFLKLDEKSGTWQDVGDKKAREKTSQALREKAPLIRKQQEEERHQHDDDGKEKNKVDSKQTRFAEGTKKESSEMKKAVLARDHSLGREYLQTGEAMTLDGFSWQDPFNPDSDKRTTSYGQRPGAASTAYPPAGRNSSHGSLGMAPPHHASVGGPPPPPDYWGRVNSGERQRDFSSGRYESWGTSYPYPPPPPPGIRGSMHHRSGSWTHPPPPPPAPHGPHHQRSGSLGSGREHSLSSFPLMGASISRPADKGTFDSGRGSSGYWAEGMVPARAGPPPPTPPPGPYGGAPPNGPALPYRQPPSPSSSTTSPKPPYIVDLSIAKTWSGGEVRQTWSGENQGETPRPWQPLEYEGQPKPIPCADRSPMLADDSYSLMPRPQIVKRDTSHQNEDYETKPSVKRAALNRDNSMASNRLKKEYMPDHYGQKFDSEQEVKNLSSNLEQSTLSPGDKSQRPKPKPIAEEGRVSTIDVIAMDLIGKPAPLLEGNRVSTIDALDLNFDDDADIDPLPAKTSIPRPENLTTENRLTTTEFLDLVNSPLTDDDRAASSIEQSSLVEPLPLNQERRLTDEWLTQA